MANVKVYDLIIIGSGISGLYAAHNLKKHSSNPSFLILEKNGKNKLGGRAGNDTFYDTEIVIGAGIGRKNNDKLLYSLVKEMNIDINESSVKPLYSPLLKPENVKEIHAHLKSKYDKSKHADLTFKKFAISILGRDIYDNFVDSSGYSDYESADALDTLVNYGMEYNTCCWKFFSFSWKSLTHALMNSIGEDKIVFSSNVESLEQNSSSIKVHTSTGKYICKKVIIATDIDTVRNLIKDPIYKDVAGQPFIRIYVKFTDDSSKIMQEHIKGYTIVPGILQKIIPINPAKGIYMIAYSDNKNALALEKYKDDKEENRKVICALAEKSLGLPKHCLKMMGMKSYFWTNGTHYYKPLNRKLHDSRKDFIRKIQNPVKNIHVIGEAVSKHQGWSEGALESVMEIFPELL